MKILLTHPSADLYGSDRMALVALRALVRAGHSVTAVVPTDGPLIGVMTDAGAHVSVEDTAVLRKSALSPRGLVRLLATVLRSVPTIVRIVRRTAPDVLYANTIVQPWWILAARLGRCPVVVHVREAEERAPYLVRALLYSPLILADVVVCNSRATRAELGAVLPALARRSVVVYNGKDWSSYRSSGTARRGDHEPARLTVVGRLSPRKGQDIAIRALAGLTVAGHEAVLTLVGSVFPGYEWFEDELRKEAAGLGVADRVRFVEFQQDIRPALDETDIAIVPSRVEPFGTVAAECMAAGLLTIVTDAQGLTEIVEDGRTGLTFPVGDHGALADRCVQALSRTPEVVAMAAAGQRHVNEKFGLDRYEREIVAAIESTGASRA